MDKKNPFVLHLVRNVVFLNMNTQSIVVELNIDSNVYAELKNAAKIHRFEAKTNLSVTWSVESRWTKRTGKYRKLLLLTAKFPTDSNIKDAAINMLRVAKIVVREQKIKRMQQEVATLRELMQY